MPSVLVRPPSPRLADGELTHLERVTVDGALAQQQWLGYVDTWRRLGWTPIQGAAADGVPGAVFVEDTVVVFGSTVVLTSPGADSRRGELAGVAAVVDRPGVDLHRILAPA